MRLIRFLYLSSILPLTLAAGSDGTGPEVLNAMPINADSSEVQFVVVSISGPTSEINGYYKFSQAFRDSTTKPSGTFQRVDNIYYSAVETHDFGWVDVYSFFSGNRILYTPMPSEGDYFISFPPASLKETSFEVSDQIKTPNILSFVTSDSIKSDSLWRRVAKTDIFDSISTLSNFEVYVIKQNSSAEWFIVAQAIQLLIGIDYEIIGLPTEYSLSNAYPNPFNPNTTIEYSLPQSGETSLIVYNLMGQEVDRLINGEQNAGFHIVNWNASKFASGIYFYRLQAGDFVQTRKMVLLK